MNNFFILAIAVFLGSLFVSRWLGEQAMEILSVAEKAKLVDGFAGMRKYSLIPIMLMVLLFIVGSRLWPEFALYVNLGFIISFITWVIYTIILSVKKFHILQFPQSYINKTVWSRVVKYLGLILFVILVVIDRLQK